MRVTFPRIGGTPPGTTDAGKSGRTNVSALFSELQKLYQNRGRQQWKASGTRRESELKATCKAENDRFSALQVVSFGQVRMSQQAKGNVVGAVPLEMRGGACIAQALAHEGALRCDLWGEVAHVRVE